MRWIVILMLAFFFFWTNDSRADETHRVKKGETLYGIAKAHGSTVRAIKKANGLSGNLIRPGKRLKVPDKKSAPEEVLPTSPTSVELEEGAAESESVELSETEDSEGPAELSFNDESLVYYSESSDGEERAGEPKADSLLAAATEFLGIPYRFGGESKKGIDCSAFVQQVFRSFNIDLPRTAREQFKAGIKVSREDLKVGDLFFFNTYARYPSHVGIYMGDGKMIHASSRYRKVSISSVDDPYYRKRLAGIIRIADTRMASLALER